MRLNAVIRKSIFGVALAAACASAVGQAPATGPSAPTTARPLPEIVFDIRQRDQEFHKLFPTQAALGDPKLRSANAEEGKKLLQAILANIDQLAAAQPNGAKARPEARALYESLMIVLDDADTKAAIAKRAASTDLDDSLRAKRISMLARWYAAGKDDAKQNALVSELETLGKENKTDVALTSFAMQLRGSDANPEATKRLEELASNVMQNELSPKIKTALENLAKFKSLEGKPMTVSGKLPDGRPFSSAEWKGKVILVDFWAVWCMPCRVELPRVKKAYADYHDKGLEVLGVSNDYDLDALNAYTKQEGMTWPNLFDPEAAADQEWNPITKGFGVDGLPAMFLIDKAGICRSVNAMPDLEKQIPKLLAE